MNTGIARKPRPSLRQMAGMAIRAEAWSHSMMNPKVLHQSSKGPE